jgi:hypothetical protein
VPDVWAYHGGGESSHDTWSRELVWWEGTLGFAALHWHRRDYAVACTIAVARAMTLALRRPRRAREVWRRLIHGTREFRRRAAAPAVSR